MDNDAHNAGCRDCTSVCDCHEYEGEESGLHGKLTGKFVSCLDQVMFHSYLYEERH